MKEKKDNWILSQSGHHDLSLNIQKPKKMYGIPLVIQSLFNEILEHNEEISPKRLLNKIVVARKKNEKKKSDERNAKYDFPIKFIPDLKQVLILIIILINQLLTSHF